MSNLLAEAIACDDGDRAASRRCQPKATYRLAPAGHA
jgi:hypothetical protein